MILGVAAVLAVAIAWALGADLGRASMVRLRRSWLVFAALGVQLVVFTGLGRLVPAGAHVPLHVASYGLLVLFLLLNGRNLGLAVAGAGLFANLLAIVANGGRMPVSAAAWAEANGSRGSGV